MGCLVFQVKVQFLWVYEKVGSPQGQACPCAEQRAARWSYKVLVTKAQLAPGTPSVASACYPPWTQSLHPSHLVGEFWNLHNALLPQDLKFPDSASPPALGMTIKQHP